MCVEHKFAGSSPVWGWNFSVILDIDSDYWYLNFPGEEGGSFVRLTTSLICMPTACKDIKLVKDRDVA